TLAVNSLPRTLYGWYYNGAGAQLSPTSASSLNTVVQNGYYLVRAVDSLGCDGKDTLFTKTVPKPIIKIAPVSGACVNDTAILNGLASNIDTTINKPRYDWYVGSFIYVNDTVHSKVSVTQPATYKLVYSIGECKSADSTNVVFNPRPITNLVHDRDMCEESDSIAGIVIDGGDGFKYKWKAVSESSNKKYFTGDSTRSITIKRAGTYYVQVYNEFNCPTKDSVKVLNACEPRVFPADAFTPNGDSRNDEYIIHNKYVGDFEFTVFSRWGEIIYHTTDPNKPWDGRFKGDDMPAGVYPWTLTYTGDTGKYKGPFKKVGKVTVIR
ncbi:MAG: gliding motility-associated C-terminal domain-containing protein, partial [Cytophagales bacterium]|nr:gliding motility-associated C-terminal domain-containing protein [Cytophagales bacterium]